MMLIISYMFGWFLGVISLASTELGLFRSIFYSFDLFR